MTRDTGKVNGRSRRKRGIANWITGPHILDMNRNRSQASQTAHGPLASVADRSRTAREQGCCPSKHRLGHSYIYIYIYIYIFMYREREIDREREREIDRYIDRKIEREREGERDTHTYIRIDIHI